MILAETPRRKLVTRLVNWGHWFALINIIIAIIIASIYVFTSPSPGTPLGTVYLFTNWFSHIGFLTFIGFIIFILPLCYLIPNARLVKGVSSTIAALGLALLALDALLYNRYGLHLSVSSAELIRTEAQVVMAEFGWQQWGFFLMLFVVWLSFQLIIANALWQRIERFQKYHLGMPISAFFMACFVSSHAVHVWADANLYQPIVQQDDMFPLSYPATAKTLMSRHGLLDLENYQQRKSLQFDQRVADITYPLSPVYCGITPQRPLLLLLQHDAVEISSPTADQLSSFSQHYDLSSDAKAAVQTILFGLPEIYHPALQSQTPVLLDLPSKLGLPVALFSDLPLEHPGVSTFKREWQDFMGLSTSTQPGLAIGVVNASQLDELLADIDMSNTDIIVSSLHGVAGPSQDLPLRSNLALNRSLSSHADLAPTALNVLGCAADPGSYSTGRNLLAPRRNWLVGTQGSKVVVLHNGQRIEVQGNGNYKIFDRNSGEESVAPLNTGLLSQAMMHLSRFNQ